MYLSDIEIFIGKLLATKFDHASSAPQLRSCNYYVLVYIPMEDRIMCATVCVCVCVCVCDSVCMTVCV